MMEQAEILALIQAVSDSHLTKFTLEQEGFRISMQTDQRTLLSAPESIPEYSVSVPAVNSVSAVNAEAKRDENLMKSPLVGTFYSAASPEEAPFVQVGDSVHKGQVLGIVEAMKLMNEITCEYDGVVKEVLVENQQMVEYGQPLFRIG